MRIRRAAPDAVPGIGRSTEVDRARLKKHFAARGWELRDEELLRERLRTMAKGGYENQVSAVVARPLPREEPD